MDYEFFQSLTADEAQTYLQRFLEVERQALRDMEPQAANDGLRFDYALGSLPKVLK